MTSVRPRRSMLFMPGSNARALEKAKSLSCDGVIFDLEDAVAPDEKKMAREQVKTTLMAGGYGRREVVVRINGLDTPWWQEDILALAGGAPDAVLVPKVEASSTVQAVEAELTTVGLADVPIWAMLETPRGYLRAENIAASSGRLACFIIGTNDLVKDLRGRHTRERLPVVTALGLALLVARSYGLTVLDGVYNDFHDSEGFAAECKQGRDFGFDGKTLIHPAQTELANQVYGVSQAELQEAKRLIETFEQTAGKGVAVLDGKMIEELHVEEARRISAMAEAIADANE